MISLVLLGPPGAGKGTQATHLRDQLGFTVLASGDLIRQHIGAGTSLGAQALRYVAAGRLVPDELMTSLILDRIPRDRSAPLVIDGYPKTLTQARILDRALTEAARPLSLAVEFVVGTHELARRLLRRAGEQGRIDDTPDTIGVRLEAFGVVPPDLLAFYTRRGVLRTLDAARPVQEVSMQLRRLLGGGEASDS